MITDIYIYIYNYNKSKFAQKYFINNIQTIKEHFYK